MATGVFLLCFIILNSLCWCSKISFPDSNEIPILSQDTLADIKNNDGSKFVNVLHKHLTYSVRKDRTQVQTDSKIPIKTFKKNTYQMCILFRLLLGKLYAYRQQLQLQRYLNL